MSVRVRFVFVVAASVLVFCGWGAGFDEVASSKFVDPAFDPAKVKVAPATDDERLAFVLADASSGDFEAALARVSVLVEAADGADAKARAEREKLRLEMLVELRTEVLDFFMSQKKRVTLRHETRAVNGTVTAVREGVIFLTDRKGEEKSLPLVALDPGELASLVKSKKVPVSNPWVAAYANLLSEKKDRERLAKTALKKLSRSEAKDLADDLASYSSLRSTGEGLIAVAAIFENGIPTDLTSCDATTAAIGEVAKGTSPAVARHLEDLRQLAALALARKFENEGLSVLGLHGEIESGGGTLTIRYDCKRRETLEDFEDAAEYLSELRAPFGDPPDVKESVCEVNDEGLSFLGEGCIRHALSLEAPLRVRVVFQYRYEEHLAPGPIEIRLGICDDGKGSYISSSNAGDLLVYDRSGHVVQSRSPIETIATDLVYELEVNHDGEKVTVRDMVEERELGSAESGSLRSGSLFLWYHTNVPSLVTSLEIEGRLDEAQMHALRETWLEKEMALIFD